MAAHFGQRNARSPLNVLMQCIRVQRFLARHARSPCDGAHAPGPGPAGPEEPAQRRGLHETTLHSVVWVDGTPSDTVYATKTPPQPPEKMARLAASKVSLTSVTSLAGRPPSRTWPRFAGLFSTNPHASPTSSPSEFVALLSSVIGSEADPDYDRAVPLPPIVGEAAKFIRGVTVLEEFADRGRPLWPPIPCTLHSAFLAGETGAANIVVITWDACLHGPQWCMVLCWWANRECRVVREGRVVIGTLPDYEDMRHQPATRSCARLGPASSPWRQWPSR